MNIRPFQVAIIGVFGTLAVFSLIFFIFYSGTLNDEANPYGESVVIWGTLDQSSFDRVINNVTDRDDDDDFRVVEYVQKDARTFNIDLPTAISEGRSPDLIILPHDLLVTHRDKLQAISYETIPERIYKDSFIDGAEIFTQTGGIFGIPFAVDPLVMYWNRDIFASNGLATPPRTWEALVFDVVPNLTRVSPSLNLTQSAVAFGEYGNVRHAKKILSMLLLQAGTSIVTESESLYRITLRQTTETGLPPAEASLSFYTQFSLPANTNYTWNRALREDRTQFLAEQLGIYFAPGSEFNALRAQNPNLNFDIAPVPQGSDAVTLRTFGTFYGFTIPRASDNVSGAYLAAQVLSNEVYSAELAEVFDLAPVRRSLIEAGSSDPFRDTLYRMALISRGWLDPDPERTETVFQQMIEDVTSGRSRVNAAVGDTAARLKLLF